VTEDSISDYPLLMNSIWDIYIYIYNARILIFIFIDFLAVYIYIYIYIPPNIHSNSTSYSWPIIIKNSTKNSTLEPMLGGYINFNMSAKQE